MQLKLSSPKIWLATQPVDFRRSIDGLCAEVIVRLGLDPKVGIFVFYNRLRDKVKLLAWHKNGFVLCYKRLEKQRFYLPPLSAVKVELEDRTLSWLLAGLDWHQMSTWNQLEYDSYQ